MSKLGKKNRGITTSGKPSLSTKKWLKGSLEDKDLETLHFLMGVGCAAGGEKYGPHIFQGRQQEKVRVRAAVSYALVKILKWSWNITAMGMGHSDHTTVRHFLLSHKTRYLKDRDYATAYDAVLDAAVKLTGEHGSDINPFDCIIAINRLIWPVREEFRA